MLGNKVIQNIINRVWFPFQDEYIVGLVNNYARAFKYKYKINVHRYGDDDSELNGFACSYIAPVIKFNKFTCDCIRRMHPAEADMIHGLIAHEVVHMVMKDTEIYIDFRDCKRDILSDTKRIMNILSELRADILSIQLVNKAGYVKITEDTIDRMFQDDTELEVGSYECYTELEMGYPRSVERRYILKKAALKDLKDDSLYLSSSFMNKVLEGYLKVFNMTRKTFDMRLNYLCLHSSRKEEREWYKLWRSTLRGEEKIIL